MISFAGVDLSVWSAKAAAWAEQAIPVSAVFPHAGFEWSDGFAALGIHGPPHWGPPTVRVNTLVYPAGMAAWGTFYAVVSRDQLTAVRAALGGSGSGAGWASGLLNLSDGRGITQIGAGPATTGSASRIRLRMHALEPVPLSGIDGEMSLLPLADDRYKFNTVRVTPTDTDSWEALINDVMTQAGWGAAGWKYGAGGMIDPTYGTPPEKWKSLLAEPAGLVLDAIAAATQRRWHLDYDGKPTLYGPSLFGADLDNVVNFPAENAAACTGPEPTETADDGAYQTFETTAGRLYLLCQRLAGGRVGLSDIGRTLPAAVTVRWNDGSKDVALSDLLVSPYNYQPDLAGYSGRSGFKGFVYVDRTGLTDAEAALVAGEWYSWRRMADADATWPGLVRPYLCGSVAVVEWVHRADLLRTRYQRPPLTEKPSLYPTGEGFWAKITAKTYVAGWYTQYSWERVQDSLLPYPLSWSNGCQSGSGSGSGGGSGGSCTSGGPGNNPAYEVNNVDLPVYAGTTGGGDGSGGSGTYYDTGVEPFVVWLRKGAGDYYLIDEQPRWEFVQKTSNTVDAQGRQAGVLLRYDQTSKGWVAVEEVYIIDANAGL